MLDVFPVEKQAERSSGVITAVLEDEAGTPVTLADMSGLTLTLYDQATRAIINARRNQNVLNANQVTVGATNGTVTWAVTPSDMAIMSGASEETHIAQFVCRWSGGTKERVWQVQIPVVNLGYYP